MPQLNPILEARLEIGRLGGGACSQEDLAKLLELSPSMISKMERAAVPVSPRVHLRLQRLLARFRARFAKRH